MVLPLGDLHRTRILPIATYVLIAINVAMFFVQSETGEEFTTSYAATPYEIRHNVDLAGDGGTIVQVGRGDRAILIPHGPVAFPVRLTLLTSMFLHGSPLHLIGNMLYLWIFGDDVEEVLGTVRYVIAYLGCGLIASLAQIAASPDSMIPTLGASGAIAGIMGMYVMWFPYNRVRVLVLRVIVEVPAVIVIGVWIALQLWQGAGSIRHLGERGGVAHLAHLGGAVAGAILAYFFRDDAPRPGPAHALRPRRVMSRPASGRIVELDAVRAFAAIAILLYHSGLETSGRIIDLPILMGWTAVDLFFLLSGFLITSILLSYRVDGTFLTAFYARRGLRIWPIYYLTIFALALLSRSGLMPASWPPFTGRVLLHYLTFTQAIPSYWGDFSAYYPPIGHFWSLAVEEQFYLIWPPLILVFGRRAVVPMALAFVIAASALRQWGGMTTFHVLLIRCDGLGYGAILAALILGGNFEAKRPIHAAAFAAIALTSLAILAAWTLLVSRHFLLSIPALLAINPIFFGAIGVIVCCEGQRWLAPLRMRWLGYLGKISYGLYVYHFIIYATVDHLLAGGVEGPRFLPLKLGLTLAAAIVSWECFEKPILAWKDRFPYSSRITASSGAFERTTLG